STPARSITCSLVPAPAEATRDRRNDGESVRRFASLPQRREPAVLRTSPTNVGAADRALQNALSDRDRQLRLRKIVTHTGWPDSVADGRSSRREPRRMDVQIAYTGCDAARAACCGIRSRRACADRSRRTSHRRSTLAGAGRSLEKLSPACGPVRG